MRADGDILDRFDPRVSGWFRRYVGEPTDVQRDAWRRIADGGHVLVTAPTGRGKTLAAFLWAIDRLVGGQWLTGATRVLYVSPLKALNNDIRRNLLAPLRTLRLDAERAGEPLADIQVETRSGDTPASDRRRMVRKPPEILITTPESLNILLSSAGGRSMLGALRTVILDEVHAVLDSKRGTHLITAVERLVGLSGEFQRIALSATVRPLQAAARFVGGRRLLDASGEGAYEDREVTIVRSGRAKAYELRVCLPGREPERDLWEKVWDPMAERFREMIAGNRSTLLFANSRGLCERLTGKINAPLDEPIAYAHHGSLSKEIRLAVERRLKEGRLKAIVATGSLELGIDVGAIDEVVMVQSPASIAAAVQRVGRAGHRVDLPSRAAIFPSHPRDLLDAAVLTEAIGAGDIEPACPVRGPLDVLAQVLVSMVSGEEVSAGELFARVRCAEPYRELSRHRFDLVLSMLAGRYADSRVRELRPRVTVDPLDATVRIAPGAVQALYASGGTIPDRGYFHLRHEQTHARIGELDEEFVWEARLGQRFTFGAQAWQITKITHNDVLVRPAGGGGMAPPFWRGEGIGRAWHFSRRIGELLEAIAPRLDEPALADELAGDRRMEPDAAKALVEFLRQQREATGVDLPTRWRVVIEKVASGPGGGPGHQMIFHTLWGARVNRPWALALGAAWRRRFGHSLEMYVSDDSVALLLPQDVSGEEVLAMVPPEGIEELLRERLEGSGVFGARFREAAGRALLIARGGPGARLPLWMSRLRSQKLLQAVSGYGDFPILLEAWRACLQDEFDLPALRDRLGELAEGRVEWVEARCDEPSPLAQTIAWRQVNEYIYRTDEASGEGRSALRGDLVREVALSGELRPAIAAEVLAEFERKRGRLEPGYSPRSAPELVDWVSRRVALPAREFDALIEAMARDHDLDRRALDEHLLGRLLRRRYAGSAGELLVAVDQADRLDAALAGAGESGGEGELADVLGDWLAYYGPVDRERIVATFGLDAARVEAALHELADEERIVVDRIVEGARAEQACDRENLETLLRMARRRSAPALETSPADRLPLLLACRQGLARPGEDLDDLRDRIEALLALPLPAETWEQDVLPARMRDYRPGWLDELLRTSDLDWLGVGERRVALCFGEELDLLARARGEATSCGSLAIMLQEETKSDGEVGPAGPRQGGAGEQAGARYDFATLLRLTKLPAGELSRRLWKAVWRGRVTNDTFEALRQGLAGRFTVPDAPAPGRRGPGRRFGRSGYRRWKGSMPLAGSWYVLPVPPAAADRLEAHQRARRRANVLLDRYGVVFRELLAREADGFAWGEVFEALRMMELAGEVVAGSFFAGPAGPQFATPSAVRMLRQSDGEEVYWLSATDPASACGLGIAGLEHLPERRAGTHIAFVGRRLAVVSKRGGRALCVDLPADDPRLPDALGFLREAVERPVAPARRLVVETVNDVPVRDSEYLPVLRAMFDVNVDYKQATLHRARSDLA
jgi:ATP-dependent Lhr-like helicase